MSEVPAYQVILRISTEDEPAPGELEEKAEFVLEALHRGAAFVALGPVVSVDFEASSIEADCIIHSDGAEELHTKVALVAAVMLAAANSFEYRGSQTTRLAPALA